MLSNSSVCAKISNIMLSNSALGNISMIAMKKSLQKFLNKNKACRFSQISGTQSLTLASWWVMPLMYIILNCCVHL